MSDKGVELSCMAQDVHLVFPLDQLVHRVEAYEQEFAMQEMVILIDWGCSYKQERGYLVLEWDGEVDPAFLQQLDTDVSVFDYCVYSVPFATSVVNSTAQDTLQIA